MPSKPRSSKKRSRELFRVYRLLFEHFGPQHWWPGDTPFEITVGAVLTQNTNWGNVERAIENLKNAGALEPDKILKMSPKKLAALIRPSGYFNVKARRLKNLLKFIRGEFGTLENLFSIEVAELREKLLSVSGCGEETVDSIILYAAEKPTFVIDAYTRRVLYRHKITASPDIKYADVKKIFEDNLPQDEKLFNEFHALFVAVGKYFCKPKPRCEGCPLDCLQKRKNI